MNNNIFAILPLILLYDEKYKDLSMSAIILYSLFLNRTKYSLKNKKFKDDKGVFIYYSTEQISSHLHCSINSAKKILSELEEIGLIRREYQKNGLPLKIYVNDIRDENENTYSAHKQPQDKLSYKPHSYSDYKEKPATNHFEGNWWQGNAEEEKPLTQAQINRRTFGNKKNTRHSYKENSISASQEKEVSFDVEKAEKIANDGTIDFGNMKIKKRRT